MLRCAHHPLSPQALHPPIYLSWYLRAANPLIQSVGSVWPDKIKYHVTIPKKAFGLGSTIPVNMKFLPLIKGVRPGEVHISLHEGTDFRFQGRGRKDSRLLAFSAFTVDGELQMLEETGEEGWSINRSIDLPARLSQCVQDVDELGIKVRHRLRFDIQILNPDGHYSEVCPP